MAEQLGMLQRKLDVVEMINLDNIGKAATIESEKSLFFLVLSSGKLVEIDGELLHHKPYLFTGSPPAGNGTALRVKGTISVACGRETRAETTTRPPTSCQASTPTNQCQAHRSPTPGPERLRGLSLHGLSNTCYPP